MTCLNPDCQPSEISPSIFDVFSAAPWSSGAASADALAEHRGLCVERHTDSTTALETQATGQDHVKDAEDLEEPQGSVKAQGAPVCHHVIAQFQKQRSPHRDERSAAWPAALLGL